MNHTSLEISIRGTQILSEKNQSMTHVSRIFLKKHRLGPQNGSVSSEPKKMLKILNSAIIKENEYITVVEVHWYATSTHPFNGVYKPKMVVEKRIGRKRKRKVTNINRHRTDVL